MTDRPDDLDELLTPPPSLTRAGLSDDLLRRTEQRLKRDRWLRRGMRTAMVAGIFAIGGLIGWFARTPVASAPGLPETTIEVVAVPVIVPVPQSPMIDSPRLLSANEVEMQAELADDHASASNLYRQAGDAFLRDQDYSNATRCYRLYLSRAGDSGLGLETHDSWLLVSLKNSAYKEKVNVTKNDS
jgi:hypothetical protein